MFRTECAEPSRLIAAVRRRPALWDPAHPLYGDKAGRARLWRLVCRDLVPDYDDLDDSLKNPWVNVIISRWKNIRDTYRKAVALRKVKGGVYKRYIYADEMRFMDPVLKLRAEPVRTRESSSRNTVETGPRAGVEDGPPPPSARPPPPDRDAPARPRESNSSKDYKNKQENIEHQILQMLVRAEEHERSWRGDEDALFFESLLPSVRRLPGVARLRLRADVSRLVHAYALQYGLDADDQIKSDKKSDGAAEEKDSALADRGSAQTTASPPEGIGPAPEFELKPSLAFQSFFTIEHEGVQYEKALDAPPASALKQEPVERARSPPAPAPGALTL